LARTFVVSAEIVPWPSDKLSELKDRRQELVKALEIYRNPAPWQKFDTLSELWFQSECLVILNTRKTATACYGTAGHALETAHHVRRSLARAVVDMMGMSELCVGVVS